MARAMAIAIAIDGDGDGAGAGQLAFRFLTAGAGGLASAAGRALMIREAGQKSNLRPPICHIAPPFAFSRAAIGGQ